MQRSKANNDINYFQVRNNSIKMFKLTILYKDYLTPQLWL